MWSWTSVRNLVTSMNSSGTNLDHACDRNTHARRRRAEKMVFYGYMVNFGASQGTWSGGGVGRVFQKSVHLVLLFHDFLGT